MGNFQQIIDQVKEAIKKGSSIEAVKQGLLNGGYNESDIAEIMSSVQNTPEPVVEVTKEAAEESIYKEPIMDTPKEVVNTPMQKESPVVETPKEPANLSPQELTEKLGISTPQEVVEKPMSAPVEEPVITEETISLPPQEEVSTAQQVSSMPTSNPFGNSTVGTNVQMQQNSVAPQSEPVITEEPIKEKKGGIWKIILIIIVILGIGAGAVFGYSKYDPFFLKSQEDILRSVITNTQESLSGGGYMLDVNSNYDVKSPFFSFNISVPFKYEIETMEGDKLPDMAVSIGDIDVAPLLDLSNQMFMAFSMPEDEAESDVDVFGAEITEIGEVAEEVIMDTNVNIGLKYSDTTFYIILNKVPDQVKEFLPVDKFLGTWISFGVDDIEDTIGYEKPEIDEEEFQAAVDDMIEFILVETEPELSSTVEAGGRRVVYKAEMSKFLIALENQEIEEGAWNDTPEYRESQAEAIKNLEKIDGSVKVELLIGRDFVIKEFDFMFEGKDTENGVEGKVSIVGSLEMDSSLDITAPESYVTVKEVEEMIMIDMMEDMDLTDAEKEEMLEEFRNAPSSIDVARNKDKDASVSSSISMIRAMAELSFDDNGDYSNVCSDVTDILDGIWDQDSFASCQDEVSVWRAYATLTSGEEVYCSDHTGFAGRVPDVSKSSVTCE